MLESYECAYIIEEQRRRRRTRCYICGEEIGYEESYYSDGYATAHMDCILAQEVPA